MNRRITVIAAFCLCLVLASCPQLRSEDGEDSALEQLSQAYFNTLHLRYANFHLHTKYSDGKLAAPRTPLHAFQEGVEAAQRRRNTAPIGIFASLDHDGHLTPQKWQTTKAQVAYFNRNNPLGMIAFAGFEVTGTQQVHGWDPRDDWGFGHLGVLNAPYYWTANQWDDGYSDRPRIGRILSHYQELAEAPGAVGFFCHPSLYDWTVPELLTAIGNFAWAKTVIDKMIGCELSSHSGPAPKAEGAETVQSFYEGLGDGTDLTTSNEACYRLLLQRGWRVGAMMSGDNHFGGIGQEKTVTGIFLPKDAEVTSELVLEQLRQRRFFATESPGALIVLTAWQRRLPAQLYVQGDTMPLEGPVLHVGSGTGNTKFLIRYGPPHIRIKHMTYVFVLPDRVETFDRVFDATTGEVIPGLSSPPLIMKNAICVYGKIRTTSGDDLVSSPIWFSHQ